MVCTCRFNRGGLSEVTNTDVRLNAGDRDTLYDARINPIANFSDGTFVIFGQKTLQLAQSALDRVNVRRMLLEVKRQVVAVADRLLLNQIMLRQEEDSYLRLHHYWLRYNRSKA